MNQLESIDSTAVLSGNSEWVDPELQEALAAYPLDCVETAFPHYAHSIESPEEVPDPEADHPLFYGCFDWHSSVHSHWCLLRQHRLFEDHPNETEIIETLQRRLTTENVEQEVAYFEENPTFEKPYGWAWLLRLAAELDLWQDPRAGEWRETVRPLEEQIVSLVEAELLPIDRPFRVGTHQNTAFALGAVLDYARVTSNDSLGEQARETALTLFGDDHDYPVEYEPLGWDFVSPSLTEADLMGRVLDGEAFDAWYDGFVPDLNETGAETVLEPVDVADEGGVALHLVGLNISRAWCLAGFADALGDHPDAPALAEAARDHAESGVENAFTDDYAGAHWLSSFVLYLLTRNEGGIAPSK